MHQRKIKGKIKNRLRKPSARANKRNAAQRREQIQKNLEILRPSSADGSSPGELTQQFPHKVGGQNVYQYRF